MEVQQPLSKYESVVIAHPNASADDLKSLFSRNKQIIESFKGQMQHIDTWGKRRLANPIGRVKMGLYFHVLFEAQGDSIAEMERVMRINEHVLRFFHHKLDVRVTLDKHLEGFRQTIAASTQRDQEREAKFRARKQMKAAGGGGAAPSHFTRSST